MVSASPRVKEFSLWNGGDGPRPEAPPEIQVIGIHADSMGVDQHIALRPGRTLEKPPSHLPGSSGIRHALFSAIFRIPVCPRNLG